MKEKLNNSIHRHPQVNISYTHLLENIKKKKKEGEKKGQARSRVSMHNACFSERRGMDGGWGIIMEEKKNTRYRRDGWYMYVRNDGWE